MAGSKTYIYAFENRSNVFYRPDTRGLGSKNNHSNGIECTKASNCTYLNHQTAPAAPAIRSAHQPHPAQPSTPLKPRTSPATPHRETFKTSPLRINPTTQPTTPPTPTPWHLPMCRISRQISLCNDLHPPPHPNPNPSPNTFEPPSHHAHLPGDPPSPPLPNHEPSVRIARCHLYPSHPSDLIIVEDEFSVRCCSGSGGVEARQDGRQEGRQEANPTDEKADGKPDALPTWTWEIDVRQGSVRSVAHTPGPAGGFDAMFLPAYAKLLVKVALQVGNAGDVARWLPVRPYEELVGVEELGDGSGDDRKAGDGDGRRVGEGDGVGERIVEGGGEGDGDRVWEGDGHGDVEVEMERVVEMEMEMQIGR